jgi:hypothetical protein
MGSPLAVMRKEAQGEAAPFGFRIAEQNGIHYLCGYCRAVLGYIIKDLSMAIGRMPRQTMKYHHHLMHVRPKWFEDMAQRLEVPLSP